MNVDGKPTKVCKGLLDDWSLWIREKGESARKMDDLLGRLAPHGEPMEVGPLVRLSVNDPQDIPTIRTSYDQAVPIVHASSGVRRMVGLGYMLMWSWNEHLIAAKQLGEERTRQVIFLFDEIESHLHPRWQRFILRSLRDLAGVLHEQADVQLIVATHSPLVLASAEPWFDPAQDAWFDLDLETQANLPVVHLRKRHFVRHGDVSNWLTSEAFDLKSARSVEAEEAIEQARALLRQKDAPTLAQARVIDALLRKAALPDIDPFWVRWGAFMEKLGGPQ